MNKPEINKQYRHLLTGKVCVVTGIDEYVGMPEETRVEYTNTEVNEVGKRDFIKPLRVFNYFYKPL